MGGVRRAGGRTEWFVFVTNISGAVTNGLRLGFAGDGGGGWCVNQWRLSNKRCVNTKKRTSGYVSSSSRRSSSISTSSSSASSNPASKLV
jgi:hypothetical protein